MKTRISKAILPVAGMGTRFLPATKSIPKEILPLVDRPLIQYAVDEARAAGIEEFIFVTARGKSALEDYFDDAPELVKSLCAKGKTDLLSALRRTDMNSGEVAYVRQREALGLGHAVACAQRLIGDESVAVLLPDDVIDSDQPCLDQMINAWQETGGNMVGVMEVSRSQISAYGVLDVQEDMNRLVKARGLVEKPKSEDAPSNMAVIGRYILSRQVIRKLADIPAGAGGEVQLTDAINWAAQEENNVYGFRFEGTRFDCGSKAGYLEATVAFALQRAELKDRFGDYLRDAVSGLDKSLRRA